MSKYYDITLKNVRSVEAHDIRVNGLPLSGLQTIAAPGRLVFTARPAVKPGSGTVAGNFKSMTGIDAELEIADCGSPGRHRTLRGHVISAIARPRGADQTSEIHEEVTFVYHHITW